jgi:hypothetical protein
MARRLIHVIGHHDDPEHPVSGVQNIKIYACDTANDIPQVPNTGDIYLVVEAKTALFVDPSTGYIEIKGEKGDKGDPGDIEKAWPEASVIGTVDGKDPAELLGFGKWEEEKLGKITFWKRTG